MSVYDNGCSEKHKRERRLGGGGRGGLGLEGWGAGAGAGLAWRAGGRGPGRAWLGGLGGGGRVFLSKDCPYTTTDAQKNRSGAGAGPGEEKSGWTREGPGLYGRGPPGWGWVTPGVGVSAFSGYPAGFGSRSRAWFSVALAAASTFSLPTSLMLMMVWPDLVLYDAMPSAAPRLPESMLPAPLAFTCAAIRASNSAVVSHLISSLAGVLLSSAAASSSSAIVAARSATNHLKRVESV